MSEQQVIDVKRDLRSEQLAAAQRFREQMSQQGTLVVRLVSSPGAGKTSLLEATARSLGLQSKLAVLVGDVETDRDARRLTPLAPTQQITTGGACHLEFPLIADTLRRLPHHDLDYLFIEDIGNLICPASHDLGEHVRVVLLSTTEGDDKPGKYPKMFRTSDAVVVSKTDLLPHVPFSIENAITDARSIQPELTFRPLSSLTGDGIKDWLEYLVDQRSRLTHHAMEEAVE